MAGLNFVSVYLFFILFIYPSFGVKAFTPMGRMAHSSVFVKNKLFFFGGVYEDGFCSNEIFYLDIFHQFNIGLPTFINITPNSGIQFKSCWGITLFNNINNKQTIYLIGGFIEDINTNEDSFTSLVYTFNSKLGQ